MFSTAESTAEFGNDDPTSAWIDKCNASESMPHIKAVAYLFLPPLHDFLQSIGIHSIVANRFSLFVNSHPSSHAFDPMKSDEQRRRPDKTDEEE